MQEVLTLGKRQTVSTLSLLVAIQLLELIRAVPDNAPVSTGCTTIHGEHSASISLIEEDCAHVNLH